MSRTTGDSTAEDAAEINSQILGMARGGGLNLVGSVCKQLALLAITALLAHGLGRANVGRYAQAIAILGLLGVLSLSGVMAGLRRFVAVHLAEDNINAVRGTVRLGLGLSSGFAVVLGATLFLSTPWLAQVAFDDPGLVLPLRFVAVALPFATFTDAALAATQGFRTMKPAAFIGLMLEPFARMTLTGLLMLWTGLSGAMIALLASNVVAACLAAAALQRLLGAPRERPTYNVRELLGFSMLSWLSSLASTGLLWADTIILGIFRSSAEVGLYSVATRLVMLATFIMPAINNAFAPRIADLHHRGRLDSLERTYAVATSWNVRLTVPLFAVLVAFPEDLLALFGRGFATAGAVTAILAAGKFIAAATGPCGLMLDMSGRPGWSLIDNITVLVVNVLLNLWWIPEYGIVGAAAAWAVSLGLVNLARLIQVRHILGMLPFDAGLVKGMAAGVLALSVGLLIDLWSEPPVQLLLGVPALGLTYLGLLVLFRISPDDRLVVSMLARRVGLFSRARAKRRHPPVTTMDHADL